MAKTKHSVDPLQVSPYKGTLRFQPMRTTMKRMTGIAMTLALVSGLAQGAFAADGDEPIKALGIGSKTCRDLLSTWSADKPYASEWVSGYFTFFNESTRSGIKNISEGMDDGLRMQWISDYCRKRPIDTLQDATEALGKELVDYRQRMNQ